MRWAKIIPLFSAGRRRPLHVAAPAEATGVAPASTPVAPFAEWSITALALAVLDPDNGMDNAAARELIRRAGSTQGAADALNRVRRNAAIIDGHFPEAG